MLESRGKMFFRFKNRLLVEYQDQTMEGPIQTNGRYMVDMKTYNLLHGTGVTSQRPQQPALGTVIPKTNTGPPGTHSIYAFPPTVLGFSMRSKKWGKLLVEHIREVHWNTNAFSQLVMDSKTKDLIQALVVSQITSRAGADIVAGKGNGLIILLHGAPGTGKTFTAETIAELVRKPLYSMTSGDIGNDPEPLSRYLDIVSDLGRAWDCVVLLEEADVFLEERNSADLRRNTLVAIFLHWLDYYEGILILTSNRVGSFDEAFKSRIHLKIHYPTLSTDQRRKIWANFITRLHELDSSSIERSEILSHLPELGALELNAREIRNAISTARHLARFKKETFEYQHLQQVIGVSRKFTSYLNEVRGLNEEDYARELGTR